MKLNWVDLEGYKLAIYHYKFYERLYVIEKIQDEYCLHIYYLSGFGEVSLIRHVFRQTVEELKTLARFDSKILDFSIRDLENRN